MILFLSIFNSKLHFYLSLEVLHPKGLSHHEKLPGIIGEYMIAPELINGQPQFINDRRYWKSIYDHGAYAIWNCGLHWSIGSIDDLGSCLSWAHSEGETGVNIFFWLPVRHILQIQSWS